LRSQESRRTRVLASAGGSLGPTLPRSRPLPFSDTPLKGRGLGRDFESEGEAVKAPQPRMVEAMCKVYAGSWSASRRFACIASARPQKRLSAAVSAMVVSRLSPELPKRADAEPKVLWRGRGVTHERYALECDLDQRRVALILQIPERRGTTARGAGRGTGEWPNVIGRGAPADAAEHFEYCFPIDEGMPGRIWCSASRPKRRSSIAKLCHFRAFLGANLLS
jgi:hypothetical protein